MDGVLIDSEELQAHAKRIAFARAGIAQLDTELTNHQRSTVPDEKTRIYEQEEKGIKIVPGALEFVRWAAQHCRLALATSATPRNRTATPDRPGMASLFEAVAD
jgi:beta-phosphoglucomutase-like phosphatase (HAD superfamily)